VSDPALPGLVHGTVQLAEWTPRWIELFTLEASRLRAALGDLALSIEHYGSTSVPGLPAKPLLDILVGAPDATDAAPFIAALTPLGYDYAAHAGVPEHLVFGLGTARTHLVHVVPYGGDAWRRGLTFRDALRADARLRDAYARLKRELAQHHATERDRYTEGKGAFVQEVLGRTPRS
jgi:GrpB-like predicted nucleotidyltransferase (UPF0157 family)